MRHENGPPLPVAGYMRGPEKLQAFHSFSRLHLPLLLHVLRGMRYVGLARDCQ